MTKIRIVEDEWYPVYDFFTDLDAYKYGPLREVTAEELAWIKATSEEFQKVQNFLEGKFNASQGC